MPRQYRQDSVQINLRLRQAERDRIGQPSPRIAQRRRDPAAVGLCPSGRDRQTATTADQGGPCRLRRASGRGAAHRVLFRSLPLTVQ